MYCIVKFVWWRIFSEIKITFFRSFKSKGSEFDFLYFCKCVCCNYVILWEFFRDNFFLIFKRELSFGYSVILLKENNLNSYVNKYLYVMLYI